MFLRDNFPIKMEIVVKEVEETKRARLSRSIV